jgi:hypothetical protein
MTKYMIVLVSWMGLRQQVYYFFYYQFTGLYLLGYQCTGVVYVWQNSGRTMAGFCSHVA